MTMWMSFQNVNLIVDQPLYMSAWIKPFAIYYIYIAIYCHMILDLLVRYETRSSNGCVEDPIHLSLASLASFLNHEYTCSVRVVSLDALMIV